MFSVVSGNVEQMVSNSRSLQSGTFVHKVQTDAKLNKLVQRFKKTLSKFYAK